MSSALAVLKSALRSQEALILIMHDQIAKKVAVAWKIYAPTFADVEYRTGTDPRSLLARLWEGVGPIDYDRLAEIAGVPVTRATKAFARLKAANLIWPDGSMSEEARKIILGDVGGYAGVLARQAAALAPRPEKGKTDDGKRPADKDAAATRKPRSAQTRR